MSSPDLTPSAHACAANVAGIRLVDARTYLGELRARLSPSELVQFADDCLERPTASVPRLRSSHTFPSRAAGLASPGSPLSSGDENAERATAAPSLLRERTGSGR